MPNEIDKQIRERMHSIFPDRETAIRIASLVISKRPPGVGRKSYLPYYKEFYAEWIKGYINKMILSRETIIFEYSTFCADGTMSKGTLYNKVNQSIRYLIDNMDDDEGTYSNWRKVVNVHRTHPSYQGVVLEFIPELRAGFTSNTPEPRLIIPKNDVTPKWKTDMDKWLESSETKPFIRENLHLTPEEVCELKEDLADTKGIMSSVNYMTIKIMRIN